jgi:hypothetical protein
MTGIHVGISFSIFYYFFYFFSLSCWFNLSFNCNWEMDLSLSCLFYFCSLINIYDFMIFNISWFSWLSLYLSFTFISLYSLEWISRSLLYQSCFYFFFSKSLYSFCCNLILLAIHRASSYFLATFDCSTFFYCKSLLIHVVHPLEDSLIVNLEICGGFYG